MCLGFPSNANAIWGTLPRYNWFTVYCLYISCRCYLLARQYQTLTRFERLIEVTRRNIFSSLIKLDVPFWHLKCQLNSYSFCTPCSNRLGTFEWYLWHSWRGTDALMNVLSGNPLSAYNSTRVWLIWQYAVSQVWFCCEVWMDRNIEIIANGRLGWLSSVLIWMVMGDDSLRVW